MKADAPRTRRPSGLNALAAAASDDDITTSPLSPCGRLMRPSTFSATHTAAAWVPPGTVCAEGAQCDTETSPLGASISS